MTTTTTATAAGISHAIQRGGSAGRRGTRHSTAAHHQAHATCRLGDRRISIDVTPAGKDWLALSGFDPVYGARPLRRLVQATVEDLMARRLLSGDITDGDTVTFDVEGDGLTLSQVSQS